LRQLSCYYTKTKNKIQKKSKPSSPNCEKLISQLTSRQKLYDSKGRERLESKADLKARGGESPDRADALIGAVAMRLNADPYAFDATGRQQMAATMEQQLRRMERSRPVGYMLHIDFSQW
jgi:hypothetical protein